MPRPRRQTARDRSQSAPARARTLLPLPSPSPATVLVAVTGLSPAVLTETVWALAHEDPPIIPDRVVVLTTTTGRDALVRELFGPARVWDQLRAALLGRAHEHDPRLDFDATPDRVKVLHRREGSRRLPIAELASLADHTAIADALVDELWLHTSRPDTRVVASLAGGYKTMGALCLSAMQLLANPGDRVTHVLVGGGFDQARPFFFFPDQAEQKLLGPAGPLRARDARSRIQLIDVPVIPLRRWFEDLLHVKPPGLSVLLEQGARALTAAQAADLQLELGPVILPTGRGRHFVRLNGALLELSPDRFAYLRFFAERAAVGRPAFAKAIDAVEELAGWIDDVVTREPRFFRMKESFDGPEGRNPFDEASLSRRLLDLRKYLTAHSEAGRRLAALLPGKGAWSLQLPPSAIRLLD